LGHTLTNGVGANDPHCFHFTLSKHTKTLVAVYPGSIFISFLPQEKNRTLLYGWAFGIAQISLLCSQLKLGHATYTCSTQPLGHSGLVPRKREKSSPKAPRFPQILGTC